MALQLEAADVGLTIDVERGARIASLSIGDRRLIVGPPDGPDGTDAGIDWGCYLMAPWAGRIADGRLDWDDIHVTLPTAAERHALHGVTYARPWTVESADRREATLRCDLGAAGWPFGGSVVQSFELRGDGLIVSAELEAEQATPVVLGWHPWFRSNGEEAHVTLLARSTLETVDKIPTGRLLPLDERTDLGPSVPILGRPLDDAYPDVDEPAFVEWDDLTLRIELEPGPTTFVVYTRGQSFCVEPQTGWPNAIPLARDGVEGTGLVRLGPGERFTATMRWRWAETWAEPREGERR
jgi:aldose 1-epimerase